jgi:hypothetical protein
MGAWEIDAFGNDDACDWAYELEKSNDLSIVESALDKVIVASSDYVESPDACEALAAIEVIARLQGNWGVCNSYTEGVDSWVEKNSIIPNSLLTQKAHKAIEVILSDNSELKELWEDSDEYEDWKKSVNELKERVNA